MSPSYTVPTLFNDGRSSMLPDGLYNLADGGVYVVRNGIAYGVPSAAEATRVFGPQYARRGAAGMDAAVNTLPRGDWYALFPPGQQYADESGGLSPMLVVAALAVLWFAFDS